MVDYSNGLGHKKNCLGCQMGLAMGRQINLSLYHFIGSHKIKIKIIGYSNELCHDLRALTKFIYIYIYMYVYNYLSLFLDKFSIFTNLIYLFIF